MTQSSLHMDFAPGPPVRQPFPGRVLAPVERRIGQLAMARLYSVFDQGMTGLANIIALAILGRSLPVEQFGAIGMMIGLHYFVAGFHRSAIVLPYLTIHHDDPVGARAQAESSTWWWLALYGSLALGAVLAFSAGAIALLSHAIPSAIWLVQPLLLAAFVTPAMLAAEFTRRWLFQIGRADLVALLALAYGCVLVGGALLAARFSPDATAGAAGWAAASLAAAIPALCVLRPLRPKAKALVETIAAHQAEARWLAWANLPYAVYGSATIVVLIGALVGPVAAGVFTAARTLTNPAMSIVSAIDSTDKPRAARALAQGGAAGLQHAIARTRALIAVATGAYLAIIALWAEPIMAWAFDGQYSDVTTEVRILAFAFFLAGLNQPAETRLIVLKAGRILLQARTVSAALALLALPVGAQWGVTGMAAAVATVQAFSLFLLSVAERRAASGTAHP